MFYKSYLLAVLMYPQFLCTHSLIYSYSSDVTEQHASKRV